MKVAVGYCHGGAVETGFATSVEELLDSPWGRATISTVIRQGCSLYLESGRNELARKFLETDADILLSLDTDVFFTVDDASMVVSGVRFPDYPIYSGLYVNYLDGKTPVPVWLERDQNGRWCSVSKLPGNRAREVEAVGMGFVAIHRKVFEAMIPLAPPNDPWIWYGRDIYSYTDENGDIVHKRMGEDLCFCLRAKAAGFTTWGDARISVGHYKKRLLGLDTIAAAGHLRQEPNDNHVMEGD